MIEITLTDIIVAVAVGGFLGWVTGGIFNLINGRDFAGKPIK